MRNGMPLLHLHIVPVTSASVNYTAQRTLLFMSHARLECLSCPTELAETLDLRALLHAPDYGGLGANEDSLLDVLRVFVGYPLTTRR
jgi:hypothetical protein